MYFAQGACWYGERCRFLHTSRTPSPRKVSEEKSSPAILPPFCSCLAHKQVLFDSLPHSRPRVPSRGPKTRVLALLDEELALMLVELFDVLTDDMDLDDTLQWSMYCASNQVTISFVKASDSPLYQVRGPVSHQLCVLHWLETLWSLFQWSERTYRQRVVPAYFPFHPGSLFLVPSPLRDRLTPIVQQNLALRRSSQASSSPTSSSPTAQPWRPSSLDAQEKAFLLSYAEREEEGEDSEEEEEEEEEEVLETELEKKARWNALLGDRLACFDYSVQRTFPHETGYEVVCPSTFEEELQAWLLPPPAC